MNIKDYVSVPCTVIEYDTLPSTNDTAKELGLSGEKENTVVIAAAQTAGRGRLGRQFFSPDKSGIYMSVLLRPEFSAEDSRLLTPAAAVAVAEAIDEICGVNCKIKWVNDIYLGNKKVCGILTENTFIGSGYFSVVGIGINLFSPEGGFPKELETVAAGILTKHNDDIKKRLTALVIERLYYHYKRLLNGEFLQLYREKSNLIGKEVTYIKNGEELSGRVLGIDDSASLLVDLGCKTEALFTGEVSVKLK